MLVNLTTQPTTQHEVDDVCCCAAADDVSRDDDPGTQRDEPDRRHSAVSKGWCQFNAILLLAATVKFAISMLRPKKSWSGHCICGSGKISRHYAHGLCILRYLSFVAKDLKMYVSGNIVLSRYFLHAESVDYGILKLAKMNLCIALKCLRYASCVPN